MFYERWHKIWIYLKIYIMETYSLTKKCSRLDDEVKELLKLLNRNEEKFVATLTEVQKETFEKYKDCNREISEISEREIFLNGFRMGARIIIDVVNN